MGRISPDPNLIIPVKTARPSAAEIPQNSVARAIKMYPRMIGWPVLIPGGDCETPFRGFSLSECLLDALRIKPDQDLVSDHDGRCRTAVIGSDQFKHCCLVGTHVFISKFDSSLREESLHSPARRSAGLTKDYHPLLLCHHLPTCLQ